MNAFKLHADKKAGTVSYEKSSGKSEFGHGKIPSHRCRLGPVLDHFSVLEQTGDVRMLFEPLELPVRIHKRIRILKPCQETDGELVVLHAVDKSAAVSVAFEGVAHGVND